MGDRGTLGERGSNGFRTFCSTGVLVRSGERGSTAILFVVAGDIGVGESPIFKFLL
jgi:hypothetical protein